MSSLVVPLGEPGRGVDRRLVGVRQHRAEVEQLDPGVRTRVVPVDGRQRRDAEVVDFVLKVAEFPRAVDRERREPHNVAGDVRVTGCVDDADGNIAASRRVYETDATTDMQSWPHRRWIAFRDRDEVFFVSIDTAWRTDASRRGAAAPRTAQPLRPAASSGGVIARC